MEEDYSLEDHPEWIPTREQEEAGITVSDLMREFPPQEKESDAPEEYWPVDEYGTKIPMDEWTVDELGMFPDSLVDRLKAELRKNGLPAPARLLEEMSPSEIAADTREANARLGQILKETGLLAPELQGLA